MARKPKDRASLETEVAKAPAENAKSWLFKAGDPNRPKGGRPKGLAASIRELYPPDKLRNLFADIADNTKASPRDRMEAGRWLSDHGYGKAPETHLVGAMTEDMRDAAAELTRDQLLGLIEAGPMAEMPALTSGGAVRAAVIEGQATEVIDLVD